MDNTASSVLSLFQWCFSACPAVWNWGVYLTFTEISNKRPPLKIQPPPCLCNSSWLLVYLPMADKVSWVFTSYSNTVCGFYYLCFRPCIKINCGKPKQAKVRQNYKIKQSSGRKPKGEWMSIRGTVGTFPDCPSVVGGTAALTCGLLPAYRARDWRVRQLRAAGLWTKTGGVLLDFLPSWENRVSG